jgi:ABC-type lipoprotein export system ATPase subunit
MIELREVTKEYAGGGGTVRVLDRACLQLESGSFHAVVGRSGTGKTTILNLIGGLDQPTSGQVLVEGRHLESMSDADLSAFRNRTVGFVFQTFFLRAMRSTLDNVIAPMLFDSHSLADARERGLEVLEEVGLAAFAATKVRQLSGGQRQRVAVARAVVNRPRLLLADEPTGNLDTETSLEIFELLRTYKQRHGTTVVVVTHDPLVTKYGIPMLTLLNGRIVAHEGHI